MSDNLYNIEPKEFKVLERHEVGDSITYVLEPIIKPTCCPDCQDTNFIQHSFMTPFFGKKKSVEVSAGTDIDILSEQINDIVEIHQRLGRINRYANKFKFWDAPKGDK